jgi:hypothetical protein
MGRDPAIVDKRNLYHWGTTQHLQPMYVHYPKVPNDIRRTVQAYDPQLQIKWMPDVERNQHLFFKAEKTDIVDADGDEIVHITRDHRFPEGGAWGLFRKVQTDDAGEKLLLVWSTPIPPKFLRADLIVACLKASDTQKLPLGDTWKRQQVEQVYRDHRAGREQLKKERRYLTRVHDKIHVDNTFAELFGRKPHKPVGAGSHRLLQAKEDA